MAKVSQCKYYFQKPVKITTREVGEIIKSNVKDEEALISAASNGDSAAFGQLVTNYQALVYNTIKLKVRNSEDAMDLSQEVFIKLWKALPNWRGECRFSTWLYRICVNTSVDFLRRAPEIPPESLSGIPDEDGDRPLEVADETIGASPERLAEQNETTALVRRAISLLSGEQREVILLRDIEGYTYDEIADMLSLEIGTVKSRLNRARSNLRSLLSDGEKLSKNSTKQGTK